MRVYELAWALRTDTRVVIDRLRAEGEWVTSHLSTVSAPVSRRLLDDPPPATRTDIEPSIGVPQHLLARNEPVERPSSNVPGPGEVARARMPRFRRRPGPAPLSLKPPWRPEFDDYVDWRGRPDLDQFGDEVTTRDVAEMCDVSQATVRQWVRRGHITPIRKDGNSHVFATYEVLVAHERIESRTRAPGRTAGEQSFSLYAFNGPSVPAKYHDVVVDIPQAAGLINLSPSTIRSWIHRGHLTPLPSSKPHATRLRVGDVLAAARRGRPSRRR